MIGSHIEKTLFEVGITDRQWKKTEQESRRGKAKGIFGVKCWKTPGGHRKKWLLIDLDHDQR